MDVTVLRNLVYIIWYPAFDQTKSSLHLSSILLNTSIMNVCLLSRLGLLSVLNIW